MADEAYRMGICPECWGCGQVADTLRREPWSLWAALAPARAGAVAAGVVRPAVCGGCLGEGLVLLAPAVARRRTGVGWR